MERLDPSPTALVATRYGPMIALRQDRFIGRSLALYGECGHDEQTFLRQLARPGAVVVEVGANIGLHTIPLARHLGTEGHLIAIEPQPFVFQVLTGNVALAGLTTVRTINAACGPAAGEIVIPRPDYAQPGNFGGVSAGAEHGDRVRLLALDDLGLSRLHLLKIDVEGMEHGVLLGAAETIQRCRPILYVENDRQEKSAELITFILGLGYRLWWHLTPLYNPDNRRGVAENIFPGILSINMLALPAERPAQVENLRPVTGPEDWWRERA